MGDQFIVDFINTDVWVPGQLFAGEADILTRGELILSGQNIAQYAPLGRITASGKMKIWDPAASDGSQVLAAIAANSVDATSGGDQWGPTYYGGVFNIDAIAWPCGTSTLQKVMAFPGGALKALHLPGSATHI
jgi:hypothetical protein